MDGPNSKRKKKKQLPKKKFSREEVIEILFDDDYFDSDETNSGDSEHETSRTPTDVMSTDKTRTQEEMEIAIHEACKDGDVNSVEELLNSKPSLISAKEEEWNGWGPLHHACYNFNVDVVELLLKRGANVNEVDSDLCTPLLALIYRMGDDEAMPLGARKPRHSRNEFETLRVMLEAGADLHVVDTQGGTPWCDYLGEEMGNPKVLKLLFEYGLDVNLKSDELTMVRLLCMQARPDLLNVCIEHGGDVNEADDTSGSLVHTLFSDEYEIPDWRIYETLSVLLDNGFKQIDFELDEVTALCEAAFHTNLECVKLLLEHGARADIGQPLDFLSRAEYCEDFIMIAHLLIQHGATLDPQYKDGEETIQTLFRPHGMGYGTAGSIVRMIIHENALKIPDNLWARIDLGCSVLEFVRGYYSIGMVPFFFHLGYIMSIQPSPGVFMSVSPYRKPLHARGLQALCRIALRRVLGCPLSAVVEKLPLPRLMKDYLCMKDMVK